MFEKGQEVEVEFPEWLAEDRGMDSRFFEGEIKAITDKAVLVETVDKDEIWVPTEVDGVEVL